MSETGKEQSARRQKILDDPMTSEAVKRAMLHFWRKLDEIECDCGAATSGLWMGIHHPGCAVFGKPHKPDMGTSK